MCAPALSNTLISPSSDILLTMKILMIHGIGHPSEIPGQLKLTTTGSRQSGDLFRAKLQALEKLIKRTLGPLQSCEAEFVYPTAPFSLDSSGGTSKLRNRHGAWSWFESESMDGFYSGLQDGLNSIGSILKDSGPFDGVVGFSEGAAAAAMVASLLEENRQDAFARFEAEGEFHIHLASLPWTTPLSNLWSAFRDMPPHTQLIVPSTNPPFRRQRCIFWGVWIVSLMKLHQRGW